MVQTRTRNHGRRRTGADRQLQWAWVSVGLLLVTYVLGMVLGDLLFGWFGYDAGEEAPLLATLGAAVPAILVMIAPGVAAVLLGRAAERGGRRSGRYPAWIGAVAVAVIIITDVVGALV